MKNFEEYLNISKEIGYVERVETSIAYVSGLPGATLFEIVVFEGGEEGQITSLNQKLIEILIFSHRSVRVGSRVTRTETFLEVPVGDSLLGSSMDALGRSLDHLAPLPATSEKRRTDTVPSGIRTRKGIKRRNPTGVSLVDMLVPLGRGQRELIIGDRKTGKSSFLLQAMTTHARSGGICVYSPIGKKKLDIKLAQEYLEKNNLIKNVVIVASSSDDPASVIYQTPYTAMTIAEYFRDQGRDVLIILDDLSTHAKFYRELGLLSRRFPGRNAYPADIFYTHSKLLERAGNFVGAGDKESSITCLPVAETIQGDLTGYIQTNLMSMTDGHIFFDTDLFSKGRRPPVNPFLSVTRVGRQTQSKVSQEITREVLSFLTLYEKMLRFIHFGAELSADIKMIISTGERVLAFYNQNPMVVIPENVQIFLFCMVWNGYFSKITVTDMKADINRIVEEIAKNPSMQKQIDDLVTSQTSFNALLQVVRQQGESIIKPNNTQTSPPPQENTLYNESIQGGTSR